MLEKSKALKLRAADEGELPEAVDSGLSSTVNPIIQIQFSLNSETIQYNIKQHQIRLWQQNVT